MKQYLKNFKNSQTKGFSLLEVVIALGVLSVGGYFLISMIGSSLKMQKGVTAVDDLRAITSEMNAVLSNPQACINTFHGINPIIGNDRITAIKNASGSVIFKTLSTYGNKAISISEISLGGPGVDESTNFKKFERTSDTEGTALVLVTGTKKGETSGPAKITRFFKIRVTLDSTHRVASCGAIGTGSVDQLWQRVTGSLNDIYYDEGNVGIGTNAPVATLDVNGGIRPGSVVGGGPVVAGQPCGTGIVEGTFAYETALHQPVYCDNNLKWAPVGGTSIEWGTGIGAIEMTTLLGYAQGQNGGQLGFPTAVGDIITGAQLKVLIQQPSFVAAFTPPANYDDRINSLTGKWKARKILLTGIYTDTINGGNGGITTTPIFEVFWQRIE